MSEKAKEVIENLRLQFGFDPDYVASLEAMNDILLLVHGAIEEHMEDNIKEAGISDLGMALLKIEPLLDMIAAEIDKFSLKADYSREN